MQICCNYFALLLKTIAVNCRNIVPLVESQVHQRYMDNSMGLSVNNRYLVIKFQLRNNSRMEFAYSLLSSTHLRADWSRTDLLICYLQVLDSCMVVAPCNGWIQCTSYTAMVKTKDRIEVSYVLFTMF